MLYRTIGKTGIKVSELGFGCMRLPVIDGVANKIDIPEATRMLRHSIDKGLNYVDTAYPYHGTGFDKGGESEPFVGQALQDGYRERVQLATKLPSWLITCRADMDKYLNDQLRRLQTDHIDFYLVHAINKGFWQNLISHDLFGFLDEALADGRIRYAGFSFHDDLQTFKTVVDAYNWSFCQIQYNYLDESYQAGRAGLDYAAERELGVIVMEPLRGGALTRNLPEQVSKRFATSGWNRTPAEWALRWLYNDPRISLILSGMTTMEQVEENLQISSQAEANSFSEAEEMVMRDAQAVFHERIKVQCTACGYCMPCPAGVDIPKNFQMYNSYFLLDEIAQVSTRFQYNAQVSEATRASNCVKCGKCETHCPQQIKIIDELENVKAVFDKK
ncbi:MAG: aldo/keto reductase [Candidatus Riflebacteria bacterium]|nr:aldo/keto reductase [Candidatus Riflebacteria bacterium]